MTEQKELPRKFYGRSEAFGFSGIAWAIYEGDESEGFRGKTPIAYFTDEQLAREFIFGRSQSAEDERVKEGRTSLALEIEDVINHREQNDMSKAECFDLIHGLVCVVLGKTKRFKEVRKNLQKKLSEMPDSQCAHSDWCSRWVGNKPRSYHPEIDCSCGAAASTEAQDDLSQYEDQLPADMPRADYDAWFERSKVVDGVRMGLRYPFATTPPDFTEQARQLVKHISDAALELAFVRHSLTGDEFDESDYPDVGGARQREQALEQWWEEIKEDTLNCLTGDDTGCLDPEELDESNCELLWMQSRLVSFAAEAATQEQAAMVEQCAELVAAEIKTIDPHDDIEQAKRVSSSNTDAAFEVGRWTALMALLVKLRELSPDLPYLDRVRNEAATAALEQAARVAAGHKRTNEHRCEVPGHLACKVVIAADILRLKPDAAIGDDKENQP